MLIDTHLGISRIVNNYVQNMQGYGLSQIHFSFGSIKPDFNNEEILKPHTLEDSLEEVLDLIENILSNPKLSFNQISMALGVVCHYICDYFCHYHNGILWLENIMNHYLYEVKLQLQFLQFVNSKRRQLIYIEEKYGNIEDTIRFYHEQYLNCRKGEKDDLIYGISVSCYLVEKVIALVGARDLDYFLVSNECS